MSDGKPYTVYTEDDAPQAGDSVSCTVIGTIETPYKRMEDCPNRHNKQEFLPCTLRLAPEFAPGLAGLEPGGKVLVLYWFHRARRDMTQLPVREGVRDKPAGGIQLAHSAATQPDRRANRRHSRRPGRCIGGRGPRLPRWDAFTGYQTHEEVTGRTV